MRGHRDQVNGCCNPGKRGWWCLTRMVRWKWKGIDGLGQHFARKINRTCWYLGCWRRPEHVGVAIDQDQKDEVVGGWGTGGGDTVWGKNIKTSFWTCGVQDASWTFKVEMSSREVTFQMWSSGEKSGFWIRHLRVI